jgi:hypothetical protein
MNEIENQLIAKYDNEKESIKDLAEALSLLSIYGEGCELCIHPSIREQAFNEFKKIKT